MCAMMPIFRHLARGTVRATVVLSADSVRRSNLFQSGKACYSLLPIAYSLPLPAIVRERLVRLSHAVNVFLLLHRGATSVRGIEQLSRQLVDHALLATRAAIGHEPTNRQRRPALRVHLNGHLVVRTTDAAALHFQHRLHVLNSLLEELDRLVATLLLEVLHRLVEDGLRGRLLAAPHHAVDKLRDQRRLIDRIRCHFPLRDITFSRHSSSSSPSAVTSHVLGLNLLSFTNY